VDSSIAGQGLLSVFPEWAPDAPDDPTQIFVDDRELSTAADAPTLEARHYIAISLACRVC
jgi:hypothetical protein